MRGAYNRPDRDNPRVIGSSPRAWGLRRRGDLLAVDQRFIPTCVGLTQVLQFCPGPCSVHPHVRGAYGIIEPGSKDRPRFIPTCVGLTFGRSSHATPAGGSSPRAWGLLIRLDISFAFKSVHPHVRGAYGIQGICPQAAPRFIPTCVGLTGTAFGHGAVLSVHPHVRGAYSAAMSSLVTSFGSSPRAWGLRY